MSDTQNLNRNIILSNEINKNSTKFVIEEILKINDEDNEKDKKEKNYVRDPINLIVNSYGDVVYDGFAIVSAIENSKTPIHTYIYGYAMSMGLLIAASGHKRYGSKLSTYMYHQISNVVWGKIEEIKQDIEECLRLEAIYDNYLLSKTIIRKNEIDEVKKLKRDWFISADEALKLKIIDEIF